MSEVALKVASYNIHRCIGLDGKRDPHRVVGVIKELDADLVGLQEVESHHLREDGHQINLIAKATQYHVIPGSTMFREDSEYGNALLSRYPVKQVRSIDLTVAGREPRGALDVDIEMPSGKQLRIITTHLGLKFYERHRQIKRLLRANLLSYSGPLIILGDLNEWVPWFGATRWLRQNFAFKSYIRTFPASFPLFTLDQIYMQPRWALQDVKVHRSALARMASDHLPVTGFFKAKSSSLHEDGVIPVGSFTKDL